MTKLLPAAAVGALLALAAPAYADGKAMPYLAAAQPPAIDLSRLMIKSLDYGTGGPGNFGFNFTVSVWSLKF